MWFVLSVFEEMSINKQIFNVVKLPVVKHVFYLAAHR
jgi:hypothetical protein